MFANLIGGGVTWNRNLHLNDEDCSSDSSPKMWQEYYFGEPRTKGTSTCHSLRTRLANSFWLPKRSCKLLRIPGNGLANWFPLSLNACTWWFVLFLASCIPLLNSNHFIFPISFSAPLIILINWNSTGTCFACVSYVIPYVDLFLYPATNWKNNNHYYFPPYSLCPQSIACVDRSAKALFGYKLHSSSLLSGWDGNQYTRTAYRLACP